MRKKAMICGIPHTGVSAVRLVAILAALSLAAPATAAAVELVTEQEAQLPADQLPPFVLRGSPTRRPNVTIVSPAPNAGAIRSPFRLKIRFQVFGGSKIDPDSIVLNYQKTPLINLNQRLAPFITAEGIEISDAEVPPGIHKFRIELKDKDGRVGGAEFGLQVIR